MNSHLKKRMTIMGIVLAIVFGGIVGFNFIKAFMIKRFFASYEPPAVTISTVKAEARNWEPKISAVGNLTAINGVDVNSQASGNIVQLHFDSGQLIAKGQPLIDIDDSIDQATLKFNQSDLALQKINYQRQSDLYKRGATSSSALDESNAKLIQAQANVEKIQAAIQQKHITAPFSGKLGIRQVNLGQYVTPGQTSIVTLQSLDPLFLEFYLPEQLIKRLKLNQAITFGVEQNRGMLFEGKITAINAKVDVNTHNILVQATIPNCPAKFLKDPKLSGLFKTRTEPHGKRLIVSCNTDANTQNKVTEYNFIPGIFAAIEVSQPPLPNVIVLPTTAISFSLYGNSVYVIEKDKQGKKDKDGHDLLYVKRIFVSTGDQEGNYTMIKKGLNAGQEVVSVGELKLQDGTRVLVNNNVKLDATFDPQQLSE